MTAEIAIMNKEAVALAADSAVTATTGIDKRKIFTSANKIFALSKYHPVGIMVYGSADFMGIPWETLIKIYRANLGVRDFNTVEDYSKDFLNFIKKSKELIPPEEIQKYIYNSINSYLLEIKRNIYDKLEIALSQRKKLEKNEIKKIISDVIQQHFEIWNQGKIIPDLSEKSKQDFEKKNIDFIKKSQKSIFEKLPLSREDKDKLIKIAINLFIKFPIIEIQHKTRAGIVFAGFGKKEIFPSFCLYSLEGRTEYFLRYILKNKDSINFETRAIIIPFAQKEMVYSFMEGIDYELEREINTFIMRMLREYPETLVNNISQIDNKTKKILIKKLITLSDKFFNHYKTEIKKFRKEKFASPVTQMCMSMPKKELAMMAETLVNLTSFKRKITTEDETVGGPIDVALITKGDGFIWIKRKHYFSIDLNPIFHKIYLRESNEDKK